MNGFLHARVALATIVVAVGWPLSARPTHAADLDGCTARPIFADSQVVTCTVPPSMIDRPMRFEATFGGSHDDTRIELEAKLDGQPMACASGSKTSLFAEDGVVRLDCRFRVPPRDAGALQRTLQPVLLEVTLTVNHAQYVSASLEPQ